MINAQNRSGGGIPAELHVPLGIILAISGLLWTRETRADSESGADSGLSVEHAKTEPPPAGTNQLPSAEPPTPARPQMQSAPAPSSQAAGQVPLPSLQTDWEPADEEGIEPNQEHSPPRTLALGIQAAPFPLFGPSLIYNPEKWVGLELLGEAFVDVDWLGARGLLRFVRRPAFSLYVSGLAGIFVDSSVYEAPLGPKTSDTALGFGGGPGCAFSFTKNSPLEVDLELDFIHIGWERRWYKYDYKAFNLIMLGAGIHYYLL